jgi:RHS repeat-associated protein
MWATRLASTPTAPTSAYTDVEYAPFGEAYGSVGNSDLNFTGQNQDTLPSPAVGEYDFLFREYNPQQGRWISPDPAGIGAVNVANPQTWNRYAYVANGPLNSVDSFGLLNNDVYSAGQFDNSCSINGSPASCAGVLALAGMGGDLGFICVGNCEAFNNGALRIGPDNSIVTPTGQPVFIGADQPAYVSGNNGDCRAPFLCNAANNIPTVSQWRPPKSKDFITAPPGPYKPSVVQCVTAPNDTAEEILGNSVPIEHNPAATGLVYQSTSRGNNPTVSPETVEGANAFTVLFAGAVNMLGCLWNAF